MPVTGVLTGLCFVGAVVPGFDLSSRGVPEVDEVGVVDG